MPELSGAKFEFIEVITPTGTTIEVRERGSGRLVTRIEPELFTYMLRRAWAEANAEGSETT